MFFLLPIAAWIGHLVLWVAIVNRTHAYAWPRKLVDLLTLICGLALIVLAWPLAQYSWSTWAGSLSALPASIVRIPAGAVSAYAFACVGVCAVAIVHRLWRALHPEQRGTILSQKSHRLPLGNLGPEELLAAGTVRFLGSLPGNQTLAPLVVEKELAIPNLPDRFDGLRLVHLSDLHMSGRIDRAYYDAVVDQTNQLDADVIALTGDIVETVGCLDWIDQSLARLQARQAKLFVLGNHDLKARPSEMRARLVEHGFTDLGGGWQRLAWAGGECLACGNEMPWFPPTPNLSSAPSAEVEPNLLRLALLHTPDLFAWAQQQQFHLALAGHNHGGQIRIPGIGALVTPSKYGTRYASGVFQSSGTVMHISAGSGTLAPVRWNCPPEVVLLTLRPSP